MDFRNATELDSERLRHLFVRHTIPYRHDALQVRVRYGRGADFSGSCYYTEARIFINLGRHLIYPYRLGTHIARARSNCHHWWREDYKLIVADGYQLALFVYLHELYHYLINAAKRNVRRKEAMCDRFAVRILVDHYGCSVIDGRGRPAPRTNWDFQDVDAFIAGAPRVTTHFDLETPPPRAIPVTIRGARRQRGGRSH